MTDRDLGTTAGLIADLENMHVPEDGPIGKECSSCGAYETQFIRGYPCTTILKIQKHKRAMYEIVPLWGGYGVYPRHEKKPIFPLNSRTPATKERCEQWIEEKVKIRD